MKGEALARPAPVSRPPWHTLAGEAGPAVIRSSESDMMPGSQVNLEAHTNVQTGWRWGYGGIKMMRRGNPRKGILIVGGEGGHLWAPCCHIVVVLIPVLYSRQAVNSGQAIQCGINRSVSHQLCQEHRHKTAAATILIITTITTEAYKSQ